MTLFWSALIVLTALAQPAVTDLDGRAVDPLAADGGTRLTVLVFTRTDCPVANQVAPEIERVRTGFSQRGVRVWMVYLDPEEPLDRIRQHQREYGLGAPALRDTRHQLVARTGVRVTPEAVVYVHDSPSPRLVYRGRIDDRVIAPGRYRPSATTFDLRETIEAALQGGASLTTTPAFGCEIADLRER